MESDLTYCWPELQEFHSIPEADPSLRVLQQVTAPQGVALGVLSLKKSLSLLPLQPQWGRKPPKSFYFLSPRSCLSHMPAYSTQEQFPLPSPPSKVSAARHSPGSLKEVEGGHIVGSFEQMHFGVTFVKDT